MKVVIIGFMGSGKTSVASSLSTKLGLTWIEMDSEIISRSGLTSIKEIFAKLGEATFRKLEQDVARDMAKADNVVISTGGGAIFAKESLENLRANGGRLVLLETSFEEIMKRVGNDPGRPLIKDPAFAKKLYDDRLAGYASAADIVVSTDGKSIDTVVSEIETRVQKA